MSLIKGLADCHGRSKAWSGSLTLLVGQTWHLVQVLQGYRIVCRPPVPLCPDIVLHWTGKTYSSNSYIVSRPVPLLLGSFNGGEEFQPKDAPNFCSVIIDRSSEVDDHHLRDNGVLAVLRQTSCWYIISSIDIGMLILAIDMQTGQVNQRVPGFVELGPANASFLLDSSYRRPLPAV